METKPNLKSLLQNCNSDTNQNVSKPNRKPLKRKFIYKQTEVPTKRLKFQYLTNSMTKPRLKKPANLPKSQTIKKLENYVEIEGNVVLKHKDYANCDLFFDDEKKANYEIFKKQDLKHYIIDEIALEGLDGITIEAFWIRFNQVFPNLLITDIKELIWALICCNSSVQFFLLPEARGKLVICDRFKCIDVNNGVFVEPAVEPIDIYPFKSINVNKIRGSCCTFDTRQELTEPSLNLKETVEKYGEALCIVASQALRNAAIINEETDPNLELLDSEYCLLERIGRARYNGELTHGKSSLQAITADTKNMYYLKKTLCQNNWITCQFFYMNSGDKQQIKHGGLLHLTRFYNKRKIKQVIIMEQIANELKKRPNYQMEYTEFRQIFGWSRSLIKISKYHGFFKFFRTAVYNYRTLYPFAKKSEWKRKNCDVEKKIRIIQLIDPNINIVANMENLCQNKEKIDENPQEKVRNPTKKSMNVEFLRDVYLYLLSKNEIGATILEICDYFGLDFYSTRMCVNKLVNRNLLRMKKIDCGRQQTHKFIVKKMPVNTESSTSPKSDNQKILNNILEKYDNLPSFKTEEEGMEVEEICSYDENVLNLPKFICKHFQSQSETFVKDNLNGFKLTCNFPKTNQFPNFLKVGNLKMSQKLEIDNIIIFNSQTILKNESKFKISRKVEIKSNFTISFSNLRITDEVSLIYLFNKFLNNDNTVIDSLRAIFGYLKGKKKLSYEKQTEKNSEVQINDNIIIEKFFGSNPQLIFCETSDNTKVEILESTKPKAYKKIGTLFKDNSLTEKTINRTNFIINFINENHVTVELFQLLRVLRKKEQEENCTVTICKKSLHRILSNLIENGFIKSFKVIITSKNLVKSQVIFCQPTIDLSHDLIVSKIDELKSRFCMQSVQKMPRIPVKIEESPFSSVEVKSSINQMKHLQKYKYSLDNYKYDRKIGRQYGYRPKFIRMRILHEFIYYLVHELGDVSCLPQKRVFKLCDMFRIKLRKIDINTMPPVYCNEISWKMFIQPLEPYRNWPKGWLLLCDILLRLPLSVFVKLFNVPYIIPELNDYLKHPIKRHLLIKHLPDEVTSVLLHKKKYLSAILETISYLCYIGLLQLGPQKFHEKDQSFIYCNTKTSLLDTCTSQAGYNKVEPKNYKQIKFKFTSNTVLENYWYELWRICMNTPLGKRVVMNGKSVVIENANSKPVLQETLKAKTVLNVIDYDTGAIPGDHLGAAGLDSSLWTYLKKNWTWSNKRKVITQSVGLKKEKFDTILPKPIMYNELIHTNSTVGQKVYLYQNKKRKIAEEGQKKPNKIVRKINIRESKKRTYNDSIDTNIMRKNRDRRVEWHENEDAILNYARVATFFLYNTNKKQFISYITIRDVLHRLLPISCNKTSRACQRRIKWLLKYNEKTKIMENNWMNLVNSPIIFKYFGKIHNRVKLNLKFNDKQFTIAFIYLIDYMLKNQNEIDLLLLGYVTTIDFFSDYFISLFEAILNEFDLNPIIIYHNPKTEYDIKLNTIKSLVHCSLNCKEKSPVWSYQLYNIYKKYSDELIRNAILELKKIQLLTSSKKFRIDNTILNTPFKLSFVYNSMFSQMTYKYDTYYDNYEMFINILNRTKTNLDFFTINELSSITTKFLYDFDIPEKGIILNPAIDNHEDVIKELAHRFYLYLNKIRKNKQITEKTHENNSEIVGESTEINEDLVKNYIMKLIFRVPYLIEGNLELHFKNMMESNGKLQIDNYITLILNELKNYANSLVNGEIEEFLSSVSSTETEMDQLAKYVFAIQNLQLNNVNLKEKFAEWMKENEEENELKIVKKTTRIDKKLLKISTPMDNCIKRALNGDIPTIEEIQRGIMCENEANLPHITDLIMLLTKERFPELHTDDETFEKWKQHFILQFPKLKDFSPGIFEDFQAICDETIFKRTEKKIEINNFIVKKPNFERISEIYDEQDLDFINSLITFIYNKQYLGANSLEIRENFRNKTTSLNLENLLKLLCDLEIILRTGISSFQFVHFEFRSIWLIETFVLTEEEKSFLQSKQNIGEFQENIDSLFKSDTFYIKSFPWLKFDGNLNEELFLEWLCYILSFCLDHPGITFANLSQHFYLLRPVDLFYILEVLEEIGSIEIFAFNKYDCSLFSGRYIAKERKATFLDDFSDMFIQPNNLSTLYLGSFLHKRNGKV